MNAAEIREMLALVKAVDQRLRVPETREERNFMADSWANLLMDIPKEFAKSAIESHYRTNETTITPKAILSRWHSLQDRRSHDASRGAGWRRCTISACSCPHTECAVGWLDEEIEIERNGRTYSTVKRCPKCSAYLDEIQRQAEMAKPW